MFTFTNEKASQESVRIWFWLRLNFSPFQSRHYGNIFQKNHGWPWRGLSRASTKCEWSSSYSASKVSVWLYANPIKTNRNKSVPRRNCLDAGRTFKRRLERTHPGQMKMPRAPRKEKPPEREFKYVQEMVNLLGTPFERVFKIDERQATFISPALMQGVPVGEMEEHGEHWQSNWRSMDIWKDHTKDPRNAFVKRTKGECERVMANLGPDSEFHPNQLLTAVALPSDGLCNSRLPVDISPYLETLQPLHDHEIRNEVGKPGSY